MRKFLSLQLGALLGLSLGVIGCGDPDPPAATCGNATVEAGEICDDGNVVARRQCRANCFLIGSE